MCENNPGEWFKFITLEGEAILTNNKGEKLTVPAGMMLVMHPDAESFPNLVIVDINKLVKTSKLMDNDTFGDLDQNALDAIDQTASAQLDLKRTGDLLPGGPAKYGPVQKEGTPAGTNTGSIVEKVVPKPSSPNISPGPTPRP